VDIALEAGVTLFDTADVCSQGASEEILGKVVAGRRDELLLATKVYGRMGEGANDAGLSRAHIVRACEDSLRRLGTVIVGARDEDQLRANLAERRFEPGGRFNANGHLDVVP
jgi:aryl-alcohol dehydrogenase-like predicted oxidoreductase